MKALIPLTLVSTLLMSACSQEPEAIEASTTVAANVHNYKCESDAKITVTYPDADSAIVNYQGNSYSMQIAVSASGARYVGGGLEWWSKETVLGSEGLLLQHLPDGTSGDRIEACTEF